MFSQNRDRPIAHDAVTERFDTTVEMAGKKGVLSREHCCLDGSLIQAWARDKSMRRKVGSVDGRSPEKRHGEKSSNSTHKSNTDPESRARRMSQAAPALPSQLWAVLTAN